MDQHSPQELKARTFTTPVLEVQCDRLIDALDLLQKQSWALETALFGTALHVRVEQEAQGTQLIRDLLQARGITVERVEKIVPSLQDVFIDLVERQPGGKADAS